jgi:hypothetical protein
MPGLRRQHPPTGTEVEETLQHPSSTTSTPHEQNHHHLTSIIVAGGGRRGCSHCCRPTSEVDQELVDKRWRNRAPQRQGHGNRSRPAAVRE